MLYAADDDSVAFLKTAGNQPLIADCPAGCQFSQLNGIVRVGHQSRCNTLRVMRQGLLRNQSSAVVDPFLYLNKHTGQEKLIRVRKFGA